MSQVVTELVIDSSGASAGAAQYESAMKGAEQATRGLSGTMSDMTVAIAGVTVGVAASLAALRGFVDYVGAQSKMFADMEENASRAGMSLREFQQTMFAARASGVSEKDFIAGIAKIGDDLAEASVGVTRFGELFRANGVSIRQTNGELKTTRQAIADIAEMMEGKTPAVQAAMGRIVGVTKEWVPFLRQGVDAIDELKAKAEASGLVLDDVSVRKAAEFSKQWNLAVAGWDMKFRASLGSLMPALKELAGYAIWMIEKMGAATQFFADAATKPDDMDSGQLERRIREIEEFRKRLVDLETGAIARGSLTDFKNRTTSKALLGIDDGTIADADRVLAHLRELMVARKKIEEQALGTDGTGLPQEANFYMRQIDTIEKHIARLEADAAAVGMTAAAHAKLRAEADLTSAALRSHMEITSALQKDIQSLGDKAAMAAEKLARAKINFDIAFGRQSAMLSQEDVAIAQQLKDLYPDIAKALSSIEAEAIRVSNALKFSHETFTSMFVSFGQNLRNGQNAWDAFANAGTNALGRIADKLIQMAADNLWKAALGGLMGMFGGFPGLPSDALPGGGYSAPIGPVQMHDGGIAGLDHGPARYIHPAYYDHAPRLHSGLMPDEFPAVLQKGEGVFTKGQMAALGGAMKGGNVTVNSGGTTINIQGNADEKTLALMKAELDKRDAEFHSRVVGSVRAAQKTRNL